MRFAPALALLFLTLTFSARPADELGLPMRRHFTADDYDGFSQITSVAQTAEGFTVFGTYGAAFLFDGRTHEKIPLAASYVTALRCDTDGVMWAGCDNEIGVLATDASTGRLRFSSRLTSIPAEARAFGRVHDIVATRAGVFANTSLGILHFQGEQVKWLPFPSGERLQLFVLGEQLYLQNSKRGLQRFDGAGFTSVATSKDLTRQWLQLAPWDEQHALCIVGGEGFFTFELATGKMEKISTPLDSLLADRIAITLRLPDGRYVFTRGDNKGLIIADAALRGCQVIDQKSGLESAAISCAVLDAEDGLWFGTNDGLTRFDLSPGFTVFDDRNAFRIGTALSFVRQGGTVYAGTSEGLMRLEPGDASTGKIARFVPDPRVREICNYICPTRDGLLLGLHNSVDLLVGETRRTLLQADAAISAIQESTHTPGIYFIAAENGNFYVLNLAAGTMERVADVPTTVIFWNFTETPEGAVWAGTMASGFLRITPAADGSWVRARVEAFSPGQAGLPVDKSWTGAFNLFGEVNFLSADGTRRWDPAAHTFPLDERFRAEGGSQLRFMPVLADAAGRAWTSLWFGTLACSRPLGYFSASADGKFDWHDAPARWQAGVGRWGAGRMIMESEAGRQVLWTKSVTSIARIELDAVAANTPAASWRPMLRQITVADRSWPVAGKGELRLPFSNTPLTLRYATPRYRPGADVRYETRLVGFRDEWSAPSAESETVFTNLTGGPFTFEVRARDGDGLLSETTRITFSVAPPWHRHPVAYLFYGLALLGAIFGYVRWRLGRVERERRQLETLVASRTAELAEARDHAEASSRAKSHFVASMSHELRTPLNSIIGYAQILAHDRATTPFQKERLGAINASGAHLLQLINDVLDFARIEAGRVDLRPAPFDLFSLLADVSSAARVLAEAKNLAWSAPVPRDLPALVLGDAARLRQVLDNLLGNAVKFTATGEVELRVERRGPRVTFTVSDTGAGIDENSRGKLFQVFEQAANRPDAPGAGLGLAISRRLVELMGGVLAFESTPGRGSTFWFAVPLPESTSAGPRAPEAWSWPSGYKGPRRTLLIVDDLAQNRAILRDVLAPLGFNLLEADGGESAWPLLAQADLALIDLRMTGVDGFELLRRARKNPALKAAKLVAISASVLSEHRRDALAAGADAFVPKPFETTDLLAVLASLLGLEWTHAAAPARVDRVAPLPVVIEVRALLAELHQLAAQGDIAAVRARLALLRAAPEHAALSDELDALAVKFQMSRLRERLAEALASLHRV